MDLLEEGARALLLLGRDLGAEAHRLLGHPAADDLLQAHERPPAQEQDVGRVDLDELLVRVLAAPLRRDVGDRAFQDLEQGLLHALSRDVAGDRGVLPLAGDLVHLVDVHDAALGLLLVVAGRLVELQDDVLDVLADVAGLGQGRGVHDREGHGQELRQGLGEEGLARPGGPDQEDVRLLELDVELAVLLQVVDPLVVVVDSHGQLLLGLVLADHVPVEELLDLLRLGELGLGSLRLQNPVFRDDVEADIDALVADVNGRAGDQLLDVPLALVAEGAAQHITVSGLFRHSASGYGMEGF